MVVIMTLMMAPIAMMLIKLGPSATIRIGPRATFGIAFKITRYGSKILASRLDHHNKAARHVPINVPSKKPSTVSNKVTPMCDSKEPSPSFSSNNCHTADGELKISGSIQPCLLEVSQPEKKRINMAS